MPFATVNGIKLNYEIQGTGPRVLFIHGIGADLKHPISVFNTAMPKYFTVLAFDPRGLGESDKPETSCTMADLADDAAGLASELGWDSYCVLGASMGGMVAQELVLRHPAAVKRLVLGVTNGGGTPEQSGRQLIDKLDQLSVIEKLKLSDLRHDEAWADANPDLVKQFEEQSELGSAALHANADISRGYHHQVEAVMKHDTFDRLPQISVPTLVFAGRYDGSNPPEVTRRFADQIPGARYELLDSGHGDWYFDPAAWQMIIGFLGEQ